MWEDLLPAIQVFHKLYFRNVIVKAEAAMGEAAEKAAAAETEPP